MSCGVGCRRGSDPELLWLWRRPVAAAPIQPLAWEPPYAAGAAQEIATTTTTKDKKTKDKKKKKKKNLLPPASDRGLFGPFQLPLPKRPAVLGTWLEGNWLEGIAPGESGSKDPPGVP